MTLEEFRALCEDAAGEFRHLIPIPWNEDGFIGDLSRCANRPSPGFLPPTGDAPAACTWAQGMAITAAASNIGGGYQRRHVIFHEVGHFWYLTRPVPNTRVEPDLPSNGSRGFPTSTRDIEFALGRHGYDADIERRAEQCARTSRPGRRA